MREGGRALLLSVGYGEGHHAAARAVAEELEHRGWTTRRHDPCAESYPRFFRLTQQFYHFCVRRVPWLWGITYAQTDTADWNRAVRRFPLRNCCEYLASLIRDFSPDVIICTYPLFAYMVDYLRESGMPLPPCYVVVTDSLEISRPWMLSKAALFCMPDEYSASMVKERYALPEARVVVSGFPVRAAFRQGRHRSIPTPETLRLVYGAYAPTARVVEDVRALVSLFPKAHVTLLAGERVTHLEAPLKKIIASGSLELRAHEADMPGLFARSHLYIGKAGAATMFEAYSSELPCIVNYALPGQEQGNLSLLLRDGAGLCAQSTRELLQAVSAMLDHQAAGWSAHVGAMRRAGRSHGAERVVNFIVSHRNHEPF